MKLYNVTTVLREIENCKDVPFQWYCCDRIEARPYGKLIENYDADADEAFDAETAIDELFTEAEATALKEYIDRHYGSLGVTTIHEVTLPIPLQTLSFQARDLTTSNGLHMLWSDLTYTLPFRAEGYFNLVGCRLADGSGVYHHPYYLRLPDGNVRLQTQSEVAENAEGPEIVLTFNEL